MYCVVNEKGYVTALSADDKPSYGEKIAAESYSQNRAIEVCHLVGHGAEIEFIKAVTKEQQERINERSTILSMLADQQRSTKVDSHEWKELSAVMRALFDLNTVLSEGIIKE